MTRMSGGTGIFGRFSGGMTSLTMPSPRLPADCIPCLIIYQNPASNVMSPPDARERPTPAPRARRGAEICFQCRNRKVGSHRSHEEVLVMLHSGASQYR